MILSGNELHDLIDRGVISALHENVNGSSIDIRLGSEILVESRITDWMESDSIHMTDKSGSQWQRIIIPDTGYCLEPGEFLLAHTVEMFNMPLDLSAEFKLKSTQARNGLNHALAAWCDPGWTGSVLTLEFHNMNRFHSIILKAGEKCGQMVFHKHTEVHISRSYSVHGSYNGDMTVRHGKGIK